MTDWVKLIPVTGVLALVAALVLGFMLFGLEAFAAKPSNPDHMVAEMSNEYPIGPHSNLNINGKKEGFDCDPNSGGASAFILEYGESTMKRSAVVNPWRSANLHWW